MILTYKSDNGLTVLQQVCDSKGDAKRAVQFLKNTYRAQDFGVTPHAVKAWVTIPPSQIQVHRWVCEYALKPGCGAPRQAEETREETTSHDS